eukprot:227435_1
MAKMGPDRQVLLFSATMPKQLVEFSRAGLKDPAVVRLDSDSKMSDKLEMVFFTVRSDEKIGALLYILREIVPDGEQTLVFAPTRYVAELLCRILEHIGTRVSMIFGSLDQVARVANLGRFRNKNVDVLVVTDLASRGLDIPLLDNVICFGLPDRPRGFVHRVGRVARAGRTGRAYALVEPTELAYLVDLSVFLGRPLHTVPEDGEEIDKEKMYYGTIPRSLLDNEVPFVKNLLKAQDDLANLLNVSKKAEILYNKTRSGASPASVRRVKRLHPGKIHPMLAHLYKKEERALDECVNVLKSYRPSSTIFELGTNRTKAGFMRAKRREHQQSIVEKQERAERIKKRKRQEAVEMIDSSDSEVDISDSGGESELEHIDAVDTTDVVSVSVIPTEGSSGSSKQKRTLAYKDPSGMEPTQKFRDQKFYVSSEPENKFADSLTNFTSDRQPRVDEVAFEVNPDETDALNKKRLVKKWDAKKRKYRKCFVDEDIHQLKKRQRNECGKVIKGKDKSDVYKKWSKKSKKTLGVIGQDEGRAVTGAESSRENQWGAVRKYRHMSGADGDPKAGRKGVKSELKSSEVILKKRKDKLKQSTKVQRAKQRASKKSEMKRRNPKIRRVKSRKR